ncbi:MAG: NADH-quinone oxidoreductase subunit L [Bdellovibrionales bacterium]|nr:NADH-quinone oxidoreductase subunit L [Bdellovibrionales bacterium]
MNEQLLLGLLVVLPFLGFLFNGIRFTSKNYKLAGTVASTASGLCFLISLTLVAKLIGMPEGERVITSHFFDWFLAGDFSVSASFLLDPINAVMILVITGVGTLIHIFSIGYISHDERPSKYFAYLNLFLMNMLILVLGDNLLVMFVGWEGVGLCSYLLIGFWFSDPEKAAAGMKAFITNRIGDAGFLLGIFMLFLSFGTVTFSEIATRLPETAEMMWTGPITLACLFLFIGATGKSAQIPLYVWLPDAMAGPTPVSALIHAATMVTAGVYMIVRMSDVFVLAPLVMNVIAIIGALTALGAATIGMTQWDIKKILAYSTVSQLGYMFLAVGVGAFIPAMFHLMTHAFFKALMFLGSGSVIHAMADEQDVRKMGGLKKYMPITHFTFLLGWLAIIGAPPLAGFFSKDEILWYSFASPAGHWSLWVAGVIAAGCTAFYMTRLMCLTFWGESRVPKEVHPHESPVSMTFPLIVLGVLSVVGGWIGIPHVLGAIIPGHPPNVLEHWLEPVVRMLKPEHASAAVEFALMGISLSVAGISAYFAYDFYLVHKDRPTMVTKKLGGLYSLVSDKYRIDEFYFGRIINPLIDLSKGLWLYIDINFIDKMTYLASDMVKGSGQFLRSLQNGNLQQYALYISLGVVVTITYILMGS